MSSHKIRIASIIVLSLIAGTVNATPTDWLAHSEASLSRAGQVLRQTVADDGERKLSETLEMLPEFPLTSGMDFVDADAVYLYPKSIHNSSPITELNNAGAFCPTVGQYVEMINSTNTAISTLLAVPLAGAIDLAEVISDADSFKVNNEDAFQKVAEVETEIAILEEEIAFFENQLVDIQDSIDDIGQLLQALEADHAEALQESIDGIPNTPEAQALQDDIAELEDDIAEYEGLLEILPPESQAAIQALIDTKQAQLDSALAQLDILAAEYRAGKAEEATALEAQIADLESTYDALNSQLIDLSAQKAEKVLEMIQVRDDDDYIAAKAKLVQYDLMIAEMAQLQADFREYRQPVINDAMLAVNFAKLNFNDLAGMTAGFGNATFDLGDADLGLGQNAINSGYVDVSASIGTMYDVVLKTKTGELLNSPPFTFDLFRIDASTGFISPLPSPVAIDHAESFEGWDRYTVSFAGGTSTHKVELQFVSTWESLTGAGGGRVSTQLKQGYGVPTAQVQIGLGTYCGTLEIESEPVEIKSLKDGLLQLDVLMNSYDYTPRPTQQKLFSTPVNADYNIEALMKPHEAHCSLHMESYEAMTHSWGKKEKWGLFYHSIRKWDDQTQDALSDFGFNCTFIEPPGPLDSYQDNEVRGLNQMAVAEIYAQFLKAAAIELSTPIFNDKEIEEFKNKYPRHTWSPGMMSLCQGKPICEIGIERFKSKEEYTHAGTTSFSGTLTIDLDTKTQVAYSRILPRSFSGEFSFEIQ